MPAALILDEEDEAHLPLSNFQCLSSSYDEFEQLVPQEQSSDSEYQAVISLKREREFEGRCGNCGLQTHSFQIDASISLQIKTPLTIENEVHRGRCLLCYPIDHGLSPACSKRAKTDLNVEIRGSTSLPSTTCCLAQSSDDLVQEAFDVLNSEDADIIDILAVMRQLPLDEDVQSKACERLWILTWDDECALAIGRVGGIQILLQAMRRYPEHSHLQQCACETLQNLAINSYNCMEICQGGGVSLLVQALKKHWDIPSLQLCGCIAFTNIASYSKEFHVCVKQAGAVDAILIAMERYCNHTCVVLGACQALEALGQKHP